MDNSAKEETIVNPILDNNNELIKKGRNVLCQVIENGVETMMYLDESIFSETCERDTCIADNTETETESLPEKKTEMDKWCEKDTKLLLDLYAEGLPQVGPLKKFKNKKALWDYISREIETQLKICRTSTQCETRYKTVLKRKSASTKVNRTSGETREEVQFENEIDKIKSQDSLEPEVVMSGDTLKVNKKRPVSPQESKENAKKDTHFINFLKKMHKEKEDNKERRHQEKMELLKTLFSSEKSVEKP